MSGETAARKASKTSFENLHVYRLSEKLSDAIWMVVKEWEPLAKYTLGRQLIRAADSIGANIAEGTGRGASRTTGALLETRGGHCTKPGTGFAERIRV